MKKKLLLILSVLLALNGVARDFTYTYEGVTLTYTVISEEDKTVQTKSGKWNTTGGTPGNDVSGRLIIPANVTDGVDNYKVVSIGYCGFSNCSDMTSISIPESVKYVDYYAFSDCYGLQSAEFASLEALCATEFDSPDANPLYYVGRLCFNGEEITRLVIPESVKSIGSYAFSKCKNITSVSIPKSVTRIGDGAFSGCKNIQSAEFASLEALCAIEFKDYESNPLYYIGRLCFNGEEITRLVIPESVKSIGSYAFSGCQNITSVSIPKSVTRIGEGAFEDCDGIESAEFASLESLCAINFGDEEANPLYFLEKLIINGKEISELKIPTSITSIGSYAFSGCKNITSVNIPNSVTSIGAGAFYECDGITSVNIPNSVTSIGEKAFCNCYGIQSAEFVSLESLCAINFGDADANPLFILKKLIINGKEITELKIPQTVISIGSYAFSGCEKVTSVFIPNSVTSISDGAFYACTGLTAVRIPNSISRIGIFAFHACQSLVSVEIPNSLTDCGYYAFSYCESLQSVYYNCDNPVEFNEYMFDFWDVDNATLYVPAAAVEKCKTIYPWQYFGNIMAYDFSNGVEELHTDLNIDSPCEIFTLNGVKAGNDISVLSPGIYIVHRNNSVDKIIVK